MCLHTLPVEVLEEAAQGLLNFEGTGIGIAEISHRSKEFTAYLAGVEAQIRSQLAVPPTHTILFLQGGGTAQFSAIVLNMLARHRLLHPTATAADTAMDYVVTGSWSKKASEEAARLGGGRVHVVADARQHSAQAAFDNIPPHGAYAFSEDPALIYYCENETVSGTQFAADPADPAADRAAVSGPAEEPADPAAVSEPAEPELEPEPVEPDPVADEADADDLAADDLAADDLATDDALPV